MGSIFNDIFELLSHPYGSMAYHLLIAFTIIAALPGAINSFVKNASQNNKRKLLGIGLLLAIRLALFAAGALATQQWYQIHLYLPLISRITDTLTLIVIIWVWAFPLKNNLADIISSGLFFIVLIGGLGAIYFNFNLDDTPYFSLAWAIFNIVILLIGELLLIIRQPEKWSFGLTMMVILFLGELSQLITTDSFTNFPLYVRLTQLAAFPLLLGLPYDQTESESEPESQQDIEPELPVIDATSLPEDTLVSEKESEIPEIPPQPEEIKIEEEVEEEIEEIVPMVSLPLTGETAEEPSQPPQSDRVLDEEFFFTSLTILNAETWEETCQELTKLLAQAMVADICLLTSPPDPNGQVSIICGYDLIVQEFVGSISFNQNYIPGLSTAYANKQLLHFPDGGYELQDFARLLYLKDAGNFIALPLHIQQSEPLAAILLLSPYSKLKWPKNTAEKLDKAKPFITNIIEKHTAQPSTSTPSDSLTDQIKELEEKLSQAVQENEALQKNIDAIQGQAQEFDAMQQYIVSLQDQVQEYEVLQQNISSLQAQLQDYETIKQNSASLQAQLEEYEAREKHAQTASDHSHEHNETIAQLQTQNKELQIQLQKFQESSPSEQVIAQAEKEITSLEQQLREQVNLFELSKETIESLQTDNQELTEQLQGAISQNTQSSQGQQEKLSIALQEISELNKDLQTASSTIAALQEQSKNTGSISSEQADVIASIAQDLRQPMSSISGYTDLLLSESVGILGALQRKFLDRVRASTDRMNNLISDLIQITALDSGNIELTPQPIELTEIIDEAIALTSTQLREKEIVLRVDLPKKLPKMHTDKDAIHQILLHLLQNAGAATPAEGEIYLKTAISPDSTNGEKIKIEVKDSGEGIPEDEIQRVFSRLYRADNPLIPGVGDTGVGLSIAKTLTEALGGEIWVDSILNQGSTFHVLLPVRSNIPENTGDQ